MNIARIIMNLKETKTEIYSGNKWDNHKKSLYNEYKNNFDLYFSRIKNIVPVCKDKKIDLILFPACTLFYLKNEEKNRYLKLFNDIPIVFTGILKKDNKIYKEDAAIICNGKIIKEFNDKDIDKYLLKNDLFISGISSTIKKTKKLYKSNFQIKNNNSVFVLDMGHHQYSGRYILTLKSIYNHIINEYKIKPLVLLAFWKFNKGNVNSNWYIYNKQLKFKRINSNYDGNDDFIDIIEV